MNRCDMEKLVRLYQSDPKPDKRTLEMYSAATNCNPESLQKWFKFCRDSKIDPSIFTSVKPIGLGWTDKKEFLKQLQNMDCIYNDTLELDECEDNILNRVEANLSMKQVLKEQICIEKNKGKMSADEILSDPNSPIRSGGIQSGEKVSDEVLQFYQDLFDKCSGRASKKKRTKKKRPKKK
jgi:hypothetical protein